MQVLKTSEKKVGSLDDDMTVKRVMEQKKKESFTNDKAKSTENGKTEYRGLMERRE